MGRQPDRERFDRAVQVVLNHEGGYVNDPADPGGETKYGISKKVYASLDIRNLTIDQAKNVYYRDWWVRFRIGSIQDDAIATKILDTCVNVGARTGITLLQRALQAVGARVVVDGVMGPRTIEAANQVDPRALLTTLRREQANYYQGLIRKNPKLARFERGWMKRAYS